MVVKFFKFVWEYFKINLQSAMEYRVNFLTQSIFMFLNDAVWVIFWLIFFKKFPLINSWGFTEMMLMMAVITTAWGLAGVFFGNFRYLAEVIREGQLDFYLALPREELTHILVSKARFDAFGDVLFGLILAFIFIPLFKIPLFFLLLVLACMIIIGFAVILGSLSFYIGSAVDVANQGLMGVLSIASYPFAVFEGYTKFILLTLIPAGFISGIPVQILTNFSWGWLGLTALCGIILLLIGIFLFKHGVKKYESGNLINVRV